MPVTIAFVDASLPYPAPLRDLLLELALSDFYRAKWSNAIHEGWIDALLRRRPDIPATRLERTRRLMDAHVRDDMVSGYRNLPLPDPNDRHIVAAAIHGEADIIVTANLKNFPASALSPDGLNTEHPDESWSASAASRRVVSSKHCNASWIARAISRLHPRSTWTLCAEPT